MEEMQFFKGLQLICLSICVFNSEGMNPQRVLVFVLVLIPNRTPLKNKHFQNWFRRPRDNMPISSSENKSTKNSPKIIFFYKIKSIISSISNHPYFFKFSNSLLWPEISGPSKKIKFLSLL